MLKCYLNIDNPELLDKLEHMKNNTKIKEELVNLTNDLSEHIRFNIIQEAPYKGDRVDPRKKTARPHLKENIYIKKDTALNHQVYVNRLVNYALFVEYGTRPHEIWPRNKKALWWPDAIFPRKMVYHPGTAPNPFFQRGIERSKPEIEKRIREFEKWVEEHII